jgi:hypothetical protein
MRRFFLAFMSLMFVSLSAEDAIIELFPNFPVSPHYLTDALHENGLEARVEITDLSHYRKQLKQVKSRWIQFMRLFSIELAPPVPVADHVSHIIFWNINRQFSSRHELWRLPKDKLILFMWEPPTVLPDMYSSEVTRCFSKIYTWDDDLVDNQTYFKFYYPVLRPQLTDFPSFEDKKLCTLVCTNLTSSHPNELYSEREKAIAYFERVNEIGFEFYGRKWEDANHPSHRGSGQDKLQLIKDYRFSICYENIHSIKGYITEKIFDCFAAGNVPVYWGASNIEHYIPKDCFIDKRDFKTLEELHSFLQQMGKAEYEGYLSRIRAFLESEQAQVFSQHHFLKIFCDSISKN